MLLSWYVMFFFPRILRLVCVELAGEWVYFTRLAFFHDFMNFVYTQAVN